MYFLAGVADAEIFKGSESFATAKALIDSSITIGVSAEDIRAGKGAKLYGKYFHSSTFDLKLSDAMFKLEYLAANVGSEIELGGEAMRVEEITASADGELKLISIPVSVSAGCGDAYIYYKNRADSYYKGVKANPKKDAEGNIVPNVYLIDDIQEDGEYCVKYFYTNDAARKVVVNANFIPDTLSIYLTASLYAGDVADCSSENTTKVGSLTIKIPRFLLSGSQEIAMSMTGAANTPLEGSALATKGDNCDGDGIYAEIVEVLDDRRIIAIRAERDEVLVIEDEEPVKLTVYAYFSDGGLFILDNSRLTFEVIEDPEEDPVVMVTDKGEIIPLRRGEAQVLIDYQGTATDLVDVEVDFDPAEIEGAVLLSETIALAYDDKNYVSYTDLD